jgi:dihydroorotate dehydrogenase (fumarate)
LQTSGAGALVMRSLFEEQIDLEQEAILRAIEMPAESNPEAASYFPSFQEYQLSPDQYLRQIEALKRTLRIPVIASLNGCRPGGWTRYARRFEAAGADAIELNLYQLVSDAAISADEVEADMLETVHSVADSVHIPVSVKLSAFHTSLANFAVSLEAAGASGVVLLNRFYQPNLNIEDLEIQPELTLSEPAELLMRLRWLAILSPQVRGSLAATGGVHSSDDVIKAILTGAHAVQVVSVLLKHGPAFLTVLLGGVEQWMETHGYHSVAEFRGAMNFRRCPNPAALERANYQRILQSWRI